MNFEGYTEAHPEPLHARKTELFTKIVALICELFSQNSLFRYLTGSEYDSDLVS